MMGGQGLVGCWVASALCTVIPSSSRLRVPGSVTWTAHTTPSGGPFGPLPVSERWGADGMRILDSKGQALYPRAWHMPQAVVGAKRGTGQSEAVCGLWGGRVGP